MQTRNRRYPARGDIVHSFNFSDDQQGTEYRNVRPALVISPFEYNERYNLILCCPITSNERRQGPWFLHLPKGMATSGVVVINELRSFDQRARRFDIVESISSELLDEVMARLAPLVIHEPATGIQS